MNKQYSISEAKNRLPAIIHGIESGPPAELTRHGKPVAVLLSIAEYNALKKPKQKLMESLSLFRKNLAPDEDCFEGIRDRTPGREVEL